MQKRTLALLVCAICVTSIMVGAVAEHAAKKYHHFHTERHFHHKQHKPKATTDISKVAPEKPTLITKETAVTKALERSGLNADAVKRIKTELDFEKGVWKYEIEFKHTGFEYEIDINAETGEIIKFKKEFDD